MGIILPPDVLSPPSILDASSVNPVLKSAHLAYERTNIVSLNARGIQSAASLIYDRIRSEEYRPQTWRKQPLHLIPPTPYNAAHPQTKLVLDYLFLISSLNFSFWSEYEGTSRRYGVEWRDSWAAPSTAPARIWTGYWSLVAAINRAIENGIPITDPSFYSSEVRCPDSLIESIFQRHSGACEDLPLLSERIRILREVGGILCSRFGGSYKNILDENRNHSGRGNALSLVQTIVDSFPSFRDELKVGGEKVSFWKRAQILAAETWAAFYPENDKEDQHPFFPDGVSQLTMFADYRVPQILNHLETISYPTCLKVKLRAGTLLEAGSLEEVSIRAASILAVEAIRKSIESRRQSEMLGDEQKQTVINSVIIDFWLWDMAKGAEFGEDGMEDDNALGAVLPAHRTRTIWY